MSDKVYYAIACVTCMVLAMAYAAMTILMLRDAVKPRADLGLSRTRWVWALVPAALAVWGVYMMLKYSAIIDTMPRRRGEASSLF